jgi:phage terminase large subunit
MDADTSWLKAWTESRDNPLLFVTGVLDAKPEPWQAEALEAIGTHDRVSIRSGHGVGKTTLQAWLVLWFMLTRAGCKIPVAANSQSQLRDTIWREIGRWHRKLPPPLREKIEVQDERVVFVTNPGGSFAVRRTASKHNPEALQGFHAQHLLFLIDEASGIDDSVFEVGLGALSTPGAKVVLAGNPTRTSGFFYDTHHSQRDRWHTMHVSCLDVPRAQGHIEDIRAKYGEDSNQWRVRVLGEFPKADDDTVIPLELVLAAVNRDVMPINSHYPIWGLDVARFGDDASALAKRQSNKLLEPVKRWRNKDSIQLAALVEQEYIATPYDLQPHVILIDIIGLGAGVYDQCKVRGLPVRGINVGEAAPTRDNCMRLRDELWFKGREWFSDRACSIPKDDTLTAELVLPTYSYTATGKFVVEAKIDLKKRGVASPDAADAFLLTFAARDKSKATRPYVVHTPASAWGA